VPFRHLVRSGYLLTGRTLADLAAQIGADGAELERTVAANNSHAARGEDPEFGKGGTAYNRALGDPDHSPNPCLAPLEQGPFYAVRLYIGDLGTFAGLRTDRNGEVLDATGRPVGGLYAVGNDAASIMGGTYPGPGITLGPGITFGYIVARHMAGANA
jgi:succinate dehydrogenase/fumarate reductase flavoprotein subunit